jgi:hypothetical protein
VHRKTEVNKAIVVVYNSTVTKLFMERIQMKCIDMKGFVKRLTLAYAVLPTNEKEKARSGEITHQVNIISNNYLNYPRYLVNIVDHAFINVEIQWQYQGTHHD